MLLIPPVLREVLNAMNNTPGFVQEIIGWAKQPFNSQGSAFNWVLFVGLLAIAAWMWNVILLKINADI